MICQHCKYPDTSVVYTRHDDDKNHTERRRECLRCGKRFFTHERIRLPKTVAQQDEKYAG